MTAPTIVILDDDPTGTQAVADVAVITSGAHEHVAWAFETSPRGFFVLTNSRSLEEPAMTAATRAVVAEVLRCADGRPVRFVSRSDSTLRGHLVAEVAAIRAEIAARGKKVPPITVLAPAFPRAGRVTRHGTHLLREAGEERPMHETHYATDATFGYRTSSLPDLLVQRAGGALDRAQIATVPGGAGAEQRIVQIVTDGSYPWIVCDAESDADLAAVVRALEHADPSGDRTVLRCSPGILPALLHRPPSEEVQRAGEPRTHGGLIVVGSHVARTTRQLARLLQEPGVASVTLDVDQLVDVNAAARSALVEALAVRAAGLLETSHVVLATTRTVRQWDDPERSLAFARSVSDAVVDITRRIHRLHPPAFVVAKGGITSSDIATRALGIRRAVVRGRVGAGILWEPVDAVGVAGPLALVPGNIGDDEGLVEAVRGISYQRSAAE